MRCQITSACKSVLLLAFFFLFISCGIPTFLNLDQHIALSGVPQDDNTITVTINQQSTADLLASYDTGTGPSLKFMYVLSTAADLGGTEYVTEQSGDATHFPLTDVISHFQSLYGMKSGSGSFWTVQSQNSAPGLYSYRNASGTKQYTKHRPDNDDMDDEQFGGILTGTFSNSLASDGPFVFGVAPEMDMLIPISDGNYEITVSLEAIDDSYLIKLSDGTDELLLADYQKNPFVKSDTWSSEDFTAQYVDTEDEYFYHNLAAEYAMDKPLYIHLFGAVYGGEGNFTNIYWSSLAYLGSMAL